MKKRTLITNVFMLFVLIMTAQTPIYLQQDADIESRVADALSRMTLDEKVRLCTAQSKFCSPGVPRLGIPEIWWADGPHGVRAEVSWDSWAYADWTSDSITAFPALTCLAASWNPEISALYGNALGEEARYRKKDVILGPGVNIYRTPLNGRNFEYMGEDPLLASIMVVPYIQAMQKNGVGACAKHYALNNQELYRVGVDVQVSDRALYEIYLPAFKAAVIDGGVYTIMGSYNKINGKWGCHNKRLLVDILKGEWGFDGVVVTDWGGAQDTDEAALYGLDVEMGSYTNGKTTGEDFAYDYYYLARDYRQGLKSGKYPMSTIEDKASRILRLIFRTSMNLDKPWGSKNTTEHSEVARLVAQEGIVLLQNNPVGKSKTALLPLQGDKNMRVLVVGDNANRSHTSAGGSSELKAQYEITPLAAISEAYPNTTYAMGYDGGPAVYNQVVPSTMNGDSLRADAVAKAKNADVVIFVGGLNKNHQQDCEDGDRLSMDLPYNQDQLISELVAVNPNVVVVFHSGNAVAMPWVNSVPAIVQSWYLGSESGNALVDVLTGAVNPSGKLPFTFPAKLTDNGAHSFDAACYPGDNMYEPYREDILVGYRWAESKKIKPLFAFGHGLSYTTFNYGKASIKSNGNGKTPQIKGGETVTISIPVTNSGNVKGKEVVQLYIGDNKSSVMRPVKELKHFQKVELMPGQTETITFTVTPDDLMFFDADNHQWKAEAGTFTVYIGSSSSDIRNKGVFNLTEEVTRKP